MPGVSAMPDDLRAILDLHRDRARFPGRVIDQILDLNQDASALILAWELSGLAPGLDRAGRDRLFAIALALQSTLGQGHTRMALTPADGSAAKLVFQAFGLEDLDVKACLERDAPGLVGAPGDSRPLILAGAWLYAQRLLGHEEDLAARVLELAGTVRLEAAPVAAAIYTDPFALNAQQRIAVDKALGGALTLVTGGPGSGKTSIVIAMLRALLRQPGLRLEDIALAAPTGKAAQRMGEAIRNSLEHLRVVEAVEADLIRARPEPVTLHRLLAWHPATGRFRHGPGNPLPCKVLIVDESSMISQEQLCRLVGALAPGARLILLGDAFQLPSVEAGCAFRDLVDRLEANRVVLTESYRMRESDPDGLNILSVARAVRDHLPAQFWAGPQPIHVRTGLGDLAWRQVELMEPDQVGMAAFLKLWFERAVTGLPGFRALAGHAFTWAGGTWPAEDVAVLRTLFGHFDQFRILCALRDAAGFRGVDGINELLHGWMAPVTGEGLRGATPFFAGEPVLMTANDYRRELFNGDQGLVLKVRFGDQLRQAAVFPKINGFVPFPLEPLKHQLVHAYAMTIHKAQGSEYDRVAIVLPRSNHKALTRELLYTGLTRARKSVLLLAERERIPFASGNPSLRDSGLAERLGPAMPGGMP